MHIRRVDIGRQGRIGLMSRGPHSGDYVFVFPEILDRWGYYTSAGGDDILPGFDDLVWRIDQDGLRWVSEADDVVIEAEIFQMRPIAGSQYDPAPTILDRFGAWLRRRQSG